MCTVLQLSDLHVEPAGVLAYGQEDTAGKLPVVAGHALELAKDVGADVVVVTGDIACDGNETAYRQVADAFSIFDAAGIPVRFLPGNHDRREPMRRILAGYFGDFWSGDRLDQTVRVGGVRLFLLDTLQPGRHWGAIPETVLERLADELSDPAPAMVFTHHTPLTCGMGVMDEDFGNREAFLKVLTARPDVRLATGHMHRAILQTTGANVVVTAPSAALAIPVGFTASAGDCFRLEPAGWALHQWREGAWNTFLGHFAMEASYAGPFPFAGAVNPED